MNDVNIGALLTKQAAFTKLIEATAGLILAEDAFNRAKAEARDDGASPEDISAAIALVDPEGRVT